MTIAFSCKDYGADAAEEISPTLRAMTHSKSHANAGGQIAVCVTGETTHALTAEGFDASEDGTGRGAPIVAFDTTQITSPLNRNNPKPGDPCHPLTAGGHPPAVAFDLRGRDEGAQVESVGDTAALRAASGGSSRSYVATSLVRRLMPIECERLQGFPDNHTNVPHKGKPAADGPRYKAIGNSKAVPVVRWIGERILLHLNGII